MRTLPSPRRSFLVACALVVGGCGGASVEGTVEQTGGEVCTRDQRVCITVPSGALERPELLRLTLSEENPGGGLSPTWDISPTRTRSLTFLKPATISFSLELVDASVPNDSLLRLYTREDGEWVPLSSPVVDRVRGRVTGQVMHLSPFVVLRADRLPDGGLPVEIDGGTRDAAVIVPPFDAGSLPRDAGVDAGRPDAGSPDAGTVDSGIPDAGRPDSGTPDAGEADAGVDAGSDAGTDAGVDAGEDAGTADAGDADAGAADAGDPDAGDPDAGDPDAGDPDAGAPDAGAPDAGDGG